MLRTVNAQPTLWETVLPEPLLRMPAELEAVDRLLDDERFFEPYRAFFHASIGRPSIPIETYLRLMFLKYRYKLGFEPLCREVSDSISWQRFCRIPLGGTAPHPTTLMKITTRCGESAIDGLNEALLAKAVEARVLKTNRVRADTTVVEANVAYPVDSSLLAKGVARLAKLAGRARAQGLATRTPLRDRTRSVYRRARDVVNSLRQRGDDKRARVQRLNAELAAIGRASIREAKAVIRNARRRVRELGDQATGRQRAIIEDLATLSERLEAVAAQTRQRVVEGVTPSGATRVVSLHDPDARPIRKGRLGRPVEFGYKAQIVDNEDGVIIDHNIERGNPPDVPMLAPAIERIARRAGHVPRGHRGSRLRRSRRGGTASAPSACATSCSHAKANRTPHAARSNTGADSRSWSDGAPAAKDASAAPNATSGSPEPRIDGLAGARTWCGHGIFNHNLVKIAGLLE